MTLDLIVKSGETSTSKGKEGLGSIAASLLDEGTKTRTAQDWPASSPRSVPLSVPTGELESTTVSLTTLTRHLDRGLDLYADIIIEPIFSRRKS